MQVNNHKPFRRSSDILTQLACEDFLSRRISFEDILQALGERTFGLVLLFFALPSILPLSVIPGVALLFSMPIVLCALQISIGRHSLWLPEWLVNRGVEHQKLSKMIHMSLPWLIKIEKLLKPRWPFMFHWLADACTGVVVAILALLLMLPIPFSNFILAGLIILFSLGFIEKDGLFIVLAYIGSILYVSGLFFIIKTTLGYYL